MQIGNYTLDKRQEEIIKEDNNYILVTAGAGSGKTLTILGKIKYLTKQKNIKPEQILCISFTKAATESLKEKIKINLNIEVPTYTFHKLSLEIIKEKALFYEIAEDSLLEEITNEFFEIDIYSSPYLLKLMCKYFKENTNQPAKSYQKILENNKNKLLQLQKLCITFIRLMKCNNYNDFQDMAYSKYNFLIEPNGLAAVNMMEKDLGIPYSHEDRKVNQAFRHIGHSHD